jgi:2-iminobutanoate/2-iminopropanoate deaminase
MKHLFVIMALCYCGVAFSQQSGQAFHYLNPSSVATPKGYSQAVTVDLGNSVMLIMSGQVPLDSTGALVGKGDMQAQAIQVFKNIQAIVQSAGGNMKHVVKLGYFVRDVSQLSVIRTVRDSFVDVIHPPASTLVQVSGLFRDDILLEIEATAIIPKH